MEGEYLIPECGNHENNIGNYHPIELTSAEPVTSYLSCNHNNTNELIGQRQFTCNMETVFDPRPVSGGLCNLDKSFEQIQHKKTEDYLGNHHLSCNPPLCPGKMDAKRYFINIDVESRLKNIDYYTTKCKKHIYKLDHNCEDCRLSCYRDILSKDVEIPEYPMNKCVKAFEFPGVAQNKENAHIFIRKGSDTVYDFKDHDICKMEPERVWNNSTKRNLFDYNCDK